jgi:predicted transcriptional regulator
MKRKKDTPPTILTFRPLPELARVIAQIRAKRGTTATWIINRALAEFLAKKENI